MAHHSSRRIALILIAFASLTAVAHAVQSTPAAAPRRQPAIDKVLADAVARGDVPGVVAMANDGAESSIRARSDWRTRQAGAVSTSTRSSGLRR
jgi:hypothetical protein